MKKMKKAIIYARQSSGDEKESASINRQIANCQKFAASQEIEIIEVYSDLDILN
jgi:DNA invertase Pin-like site-specific DNA recombinase